MKKSILILPLFTLLFAFTLVDLQSDRWVAPESAKEIKNPVSEDDRSSSAKDGKKLFKTRCVVCHGDKGEGDGPGGKALDPKPADLSSEMVQSQEDGEIFWKITNGRGPMIKWEGIIKEEERWDLVNFIRTLK